MKIIGTYPKVPRLTTGFYSLDRAFLNDRGEIGIPIGHGWEVFGVNHVGKSTFAYSLAGLIGAHFNKGIAICDFERLDPQFLVAVLEKQEFDNTVNLLRFNEDEDQLAEMVRLLTTDEYCVGILDSIGAISPLAEQVSEFGEANMGRRAFLMNQFVRKALHLFRETDETNPKTILMVNHWYPKLGTKGYDTPGGEGKKFLASVRVLLRRKEEFPDGSYVLEGTVYKNRWGFNGKSFHVFILSGAGMHKGLSLMYDCILIGLATRKGYVKIGDSSMGRLSELVKAAKEGNNKVFEPFAEVLDEYIRGKGSEHKEVSMDGDTSSDNETSDNP